MDGYNNRGVTADGIANGGVINRGGRNQPMSSFKGLLEPSDAAAIMIWMYKSNDEAQAVD